MAKMQWYDWVAIFLLSVGGINWGLVTWFKFDLVQWISMGINGINWALKSAVGVSGVYGLWFAVKQAFK